MSVSKRPGKAFVSKESAIDPDDAQREKTPRIPLRHAEGQRFTPRHSGGTRLGGEEQPQRRSEKHGHEDDAQPVGKIPRRCFVRSG